MTRPLPRSEERDKMSELSKNKWKWKLSRASSHRAFSWWKFEKKSDGKWNLSRGSWHEAALQASSSSCGTSELRFIIKVSGTDFFWHNSSHLWAVFRPTKFFFAHQWPNMFLLCLCAYSLSNANILLMCEGLSFGWSTYLRSARIPSPLWSPVFPRCPPPGQKSQLLSKMKDIRCQGLPPLMVHYVDSTWAGGSSPGCMLKRFATKARLSLSWPFTTSWGRETNVFQTHFWHICSCTKIYTHRLQKVNPVIVRLGPIKKVAWTQAEWSSSC